MITNDNSKELVLGDFIFVIHNSTIENLYIQYVDLYLITSPEESNNNEYCVQSEYKQLICQFYITSKDLSDFFNNLDAFLFNDQYSFINVFHPVINQLDNLNRLSNTSIGLIFTDMVAVMDSEYISDYNKTILVELHIADDISNKTLYEYSTMCSIDSLDEFSSQLAKMENYYYE